MSDNLSSEVSADQVWAKVPEWYKKPQGADVPPGARLFARRHTFNMVIEGMTTEGSDRAVHAVSARVRAISQNPHIAISLETGNDPSVIFTLETSVFRFTREGDDPEYAQFFDWFRTNCPDIFMFKQKSTNRYEGCVKAMVILIEVGDGKSPTVVGFPGSSLNDKEQATWNALKSIASGSFIYLCMPAGTANYGELNGAMSAISDLSPVVADFGTYWYRRYQSPSTPGRKAPIWLHGKGQRGGFQMDTSVSGGTGAFIDHHERECRLIDGSWLELREQQAQFERVFNLEHTHQASFEAHGPGQNWLDVKVVDSENPPKIPEGTKVKFLLNQKAPASPEVFKGRSITGRVFERNSPQDFSVMFTGQAPLHLAARKTFDVVLTVVVDTTAMRRQINALKLATKEIVPGDKEDGRGKGISLHRTILAHHVEMDKKSELYFELSFQQLSPLQLGEQNSKLAAIKALWDKELDPAQRKAVEQSVRKIAGGLSLIEGPPGCGKTYAAVHILAAAIALGIKVLLTAASNKAVDNLLAALYRFYQSHDGFEEKSKLAIRLRTAGVQFACLRNVDGSHQPILRNLGDPETRVEHLEAHNIVVRWAEEAVDERVGGSEARAFLKMRNLDLEVGLSAEEAEGYKELYMKMLRQVLSASHLVATTLNNAGSLEHTDFRPVVMVCDEAGQCHEGDTMIGMLHDTLRAAVLIGDPQQLDPTVVSLNAKNEHAGYLKRSLLSRLMQAGYESTRLAVNYRNHPDILDFFNREVYQGMLTPSKHNANPQAEDKARVGLAFDAFMASKGARIGGDNARLTGARRVWFSVKGFANRELVGTSWENEAQASALVNLVRALTTFVPADGRGGIRSEDIMVISPYLAQQRLCAVSLNTARLSVGSNLTVDAAQGQEAPVVIFVLTKPGKEKPGELGFVANRARLNVALSRAQQVLIILGDFLAFTAKVRSQMKTKEGGMLLALLVDVQNRRHDTGIANLRLQPVVNTVGSPVAGPIVPPWRLQAPIDKDAMDTATDEAEKPVQGTDHEPMEIDEEEAQMQEELRAAEEKVKELREKMARRKRDQTRG